jgi:hypothetical protein
VSRTTTLRRPSPLLVRSPPICAVLVRARSRASASSTIVPWSHSLWLLLSFFCSVHSPPITRLLVSWRCVARRRPLRANTSAASRAARHRSVCACARSTRGSARPHAGVTVFAIGLPNPALQTRKNARHQLPALPRRSVQALVHVRFPRTRAVTPFAAGLLTRPRAQRGQTSRPRAGGKTTKEGALLLLPATRPRELVASPRGSSRRPAPCHARCRAREKECGRARGNGRATPLLHRISGLRVPPSRFRPSPCLVRVSPVASRVAVARFPRRGRCVRRRSRPPTSLASAARSLPVGLRPPRTAAKPAFRLLHRRSQRRVPPRAGVRQAARPPSTIRPPHALPRGCRGAPCAGRLRRWRAASGPRRAPTRRGLLAGAGG